MSNSQCHVLPFSNINYHVVNLWVNIKFVKDAPTSETDSEVVINYDIISENKSNTNCKFDFLILKENVAINWSIISKFCFDI